MFLKGGDTMKKTLVRVLTLTLVAVMLVTMLVSCGGVKSGEYRFGTEKSYEAYIFKGSKVTNVTYAAGNKIDSLTKEGKYKVEDDEIIFTWIDSEGKETTDTKAFAENEDGSIKIGLVTFKPVED